MITTTERMGETATCDNCAQPIRVAPVEATEFKRVYAHDPEIAALPDDALVGLWLHTDTSHQLCRTNRDWDWQWDADNKMHHITVTTAKPEK